MANVQFAFPAVVPAPPMFSMHDQMVLCNVDDNGLWNGDTDAERIAMDVFGDDYTTCMDKTFEELDADFKTFAELTQAQGQIRLTPGVKNNIKAFVQWARDETRLGRNPGNAGFPILEAARYIRRYKTHSAFIKKSATMAEAAKPGKFTSETKWVDWEPTFMNYLRTIPGRDGVPLKYICRPLDAQDPTPQASFLDEYVLMAPLTGEAWTIDSSEVHTLIVNFIAGNETAEAKIQAHTDAKNGRLDYIALKEHYEGVGLHAHDISRARATLKNLFYGGEKKPHMWWDEFEKQLNSAFTVFDKNEGRQVYSNDMKLRTLLDKVNADFLAPVKAGIDIRLSEVPMTMMYEQAVATFRNTVNAKFPPQFGTSTRTRRNVNEVGRQHGGKGRGGNGNRNNRSNGRKPKKTRTDSDMITLTDGQTIEYHPSFHFPRHVYAKFKPEDQQRLRNARDEYKKSKGHNTQVQELQRQVKELQQASQSQSSQPPPADVTTDQGTEISQITTGTMMGGRNERASGKRR